MANHILIGDKTVFSDGTSTSLNITELSQEEFNDSSYKGFEGTPTFGILNETASGFARNYGGEASKEGRYLHFREYPDAKTPKHSLDLKPEWNNTCEKLVKATISKGTRVAFGKIKGGTEIQVFIPFNELNKVLWGKEIQQND